MKNTQIYSGFLMLTLLSACSNSHIMESITGARDDQVLNGERRVPVLNAKGGNLAPMVTNVQPSVSGAASSAISANPYDNYDPSPKATTPTTVNDAGTPYAQTAQEAPKSGNFFTRLIDGDEATASATAADAHPVRKAFTGNSYYISETTANSATPQKLSSVPEKPKQFESVKTSLNKNVSELKSDHATAVQTQEDLNKEVSPNNTSANNVSATNASAATPIVAPVAATKTTAASVSAPKPLAVPQSVYSQNPTLPKPVEMQPTDEIPVSSLPEINVSAPTDVAASDSVNVVKAQPETAPEMKPAPQVNSEINSSADSNMDTDLPPMEMIKIIRPSRYEGRTRK